MTMPLVVSSIDPPGNAPRFMTRHKGQTDKSWATADPGMCQICHRDGALLREIGHHPDCKAVQNASVKPYTALPATSKAGGRVQHHARQMNSLESRYAIELEALRLAGEIQWWRFEAIRLRLADKTYYNPDFAVMVAGRLEFRETKGHWEDDSRAKIKIAAELFPCFRFVAVRRVKGQWETEEWNDK